MNIDYEKISLAACEEASNLLVSVRQVKKIIEAYEAQKKAPEWVPLDLEKVKRGQEVRNKHWPETFLDETFVCLHKDGFITEAYENDFRRRGVNTPDWLMRAPKPKTVHVRVFKMPDGEYVSTAGRFFDGYQVVGEGDIEVPE